ncbi:hypothetical protein ACLOJK_013177 [Asimina triloba]
MADIALLVVEEFERRNSLEKKRGGQEVSLFSCFSALARGVEEFSAVKAVAERLELGKRMLEPKSPLGLAAVSGFFSA